MKNHFKLYWGWHLAALTSVLGLIRGHLDVIPGHFRMFMMASQALWTGTPAYGQAFAGNLYFYSPSCALFFFGPFLWLPERMAVTLYLIFSILILAFGIREFTRLFVPAHKLNWFLFLILPHLFSAIVADKLELSILGVLLLGSSWLIRGKRPWLSAFLLAMVINWKIQPAPAVGLFCIVLFVIARDWKWILRFLTSLAFWFAIPFIARPAKEILLAYQTWRSSLTAYSAECYDFYDNIFAFMKNALGIHISFQTSNLISMTLAMILAIFVTNWAFRNRKNVKMIPTGILVCVALGSAYTVVVSPLQQVNATLLFAPTYFLAFVLFENSTGSEHRFWQTLLTIVWFVLALGYSELIPETIRPAVRHVAFRSATCLMLSVICAIFVLRRNTPIKLANPGF